MSGDEQQQQQQSERGVAEHVRGSIKLKRVPVLFCDRDVSQERIE